MKLKVAVLPGDGIGPEVVSECREILAMVLRARGHAIEFQEALIGGSAIDATGTALPQETIDVCHSCDAVLLGAVGGPKWDNPNARVRPEQGLLKIRKELGLYANLRPVRPLPALYHISPVRQSQETPTDFIVVRELTGGMYFGEKKLETTPSGEIATDVCTYSTAEVERTIRVAGNLARSRKRHVVSVDKANVLETSRLWRRVATRIMAEEFPDVRLEHVLVDACSMFLIQKPMYFDVIVTENLFGDILTDEASVLAGSMGLLPSASLGSALNTHGLPRGLYEPIHGSAPDIAGKGIANPVGMILSAAMMLRHSLGLENEAMEIERAVSATLESGIATGDVAGGGRSVSTAAFGRAVQEQLKIED